VQHDRRCTSLLEGSAARPVDICFVRRVPQEGCLRAEEVPPEFKRDVVTVARRGDLTVAEVASDFDISEESVRRWMKQADIDDGLVNGQTSTEQSELVQLRRKLRKLEMENEVLRRATAYFAQSTLPK
jgi:transposase-like protein